MVKYTQTIRREQPTNCLSVSDRFVKLALKELNSLNIRSETFATIPNYIKNRVECVIMFLKIVTKTVNTTKMKKIIPDSYESVQEIFYLNYGLALFRCPSNFDIAPISKNKFLDIQAITKCSFTLST